MFNEKGALHETRDQTITLPEAMAYDLCHSMSPRAEQIKGNLQMTVDKLNSGDGMSHWNHAEGLMPMVRWLKTLASRATMWLGHIDCKYMMVRIDMRSGHFVICDGAQGKRAEHTMIEMIDEAIKQQERTEVRDAAAT